MKKYNRIEKLLNILLYNDQFQTASSLSSAFNTSDKTIRNDLSEIKPLLIKYNLELITKPKFGIKVKGLAKNKKLLINNLKSEITLLNENIYNRKYDIISTILLSNNRLYLDDLAKKYFISRSMINKDLNECEQFLKQHHLKLIKSTSGIRLEGSENQIRNALSSLANLIQENHCSLDYWLKNSLRFNFTKIKQIVNQWNNDCTVNLNDVNIDNLSFHIIIMINRVKNQKLIDNQWLYDKQFKIENITILESLFSQLEGGLKITIPPQEKEFIKLHIIGLLFDKKQLLNNSIYNELYNLAQTITKEFIINIEKIIPLNPATNQQFIQSLIIHLLPTIYRLRIGLNLYNPLLHTIKEEYSNIFSLAAIINHSFLKHLGLIASDEEIGFITLHLSLAIEKIKETITVAIICHSNNSIINFLMINLKKNFPYVKFVITNYNDLNRLTNIDLILTTDSYSLNTDKPVLIISPIVTKLDIENIHKLISNNYHNNYLFSQNTVLIIDKPQNKLNVLTKLTKALQNANAINSKFINGVIQREKMGNTEVGNGVVLTHGFHDDVKSTKICFAKLNNPIVWNNENVNFIVMMAIEKKDAKNIVQMNWLYKLLVDKKKMEEISKCQSEIDLYSIIKNEMLNQ